MNDYILAHLTVILLLHYLVKCKSCSLAMNSYWVTHALAEK